LLTVPNPTPAEMAQARELGRKVFHVHFVKPDHWDEKKLEVTSDVRELN
jgi:hypothetical protein